VTSEFPAQFGLSVVLSAYPNRAGEVGSSNITVGTILIFYEMPHDQSLAGSLNCLSRVAVYSPFAMRAPGTAGLRLSTTRLR